MIVVDTSVVVAILRHEPEETAFTELLDESSETIMSAVSYVEAHMVIVGRRLRSNPTAIDTLMAALGIEMVNVTNDQAGAAIAAFLAYGNGRHAARLNLADCFAYALARSRGAPLFFKGDDFAKTDIIPVWRPG